MRISLNWLKKYVDIKIADAELVQLIGARLVEVEEAIDETHKYDKIYVVKVESAEKIEGTHLNLCKINAGDVSGLAKVKTDDDGLVQVMCGAPNVRAGMLAVWIAPGAVVPASVHEDAPFVIGVRKMLGKYDSYGMLAGADELDFDTEHKTIAEIDPAVARPGDLLADVFDLRDIVLDIENKSLTHRPDCFGLIGFAREVAGILGEEFSFKPEGRPVTKRGMSDAVAAPAVEISGDGICKRYTALVLEKHGELKRKYLTWEDTILSKSGMRPVDPVVDATNYLMLLTGQPLHAFDYDKFVTVGGSEQPKVVVRLARPGEKLVLLDGKEIELNDDDIVICSGEVPVALAGAMGGASTMIDENTRNIMLEAATFSLYNLRKTQMEHGIFSEAITRFTKGQPAYQTLVVAEDCAAMLASGFRVAAVTDEHPEKEAENVVRVKVSEINGLLGTDYNAGLIVRTLENVNFVVKKHKDELQVTAPAWRTDIHIKEDIIEEIGRLLGYDSILPTLPRHATAVKNKMLTLKAEIREIMKEFGANEALTYSFVAEKVLKKAGLDPANSYKIVNSISPELQYVRQSIVPSLLDKAYMNQKIPFDKFALYEINKVYQKAWGRDAEGVPVEKMRMGLVVAERKNQGTAYYQAKYFVEKLLGELNVAVRFLPLKNRNAESLPFEEKRAAEIWSNGQLVGVVGEFKNSVRHDFKLADYLAGFELDLDAVLALAHQKKDVEVVFEKEARDLTVETSGTYGELLEKVESVLTKSGAVANISPVSIYQPEGEDRRVSLHLEFLSGFSDELMAKLEKI